MSILEKLAYTASCVTTLPFFEGVQKKRSNPAGLTIYLPAVGLIVGVVLALAAIGLTAAKVNNLLSGVILTVIWLVLTGGIHLDGLMDTADGIFSHQSRERILEIMKDSRVGNFGAMSGFVILIAKVVSLATIPSPALPSVLILSAVWSRWCEVFTIGAYPYLRENGLGKIWHDTTKYPRDVILSLFVPLVVTAATAMAGFASWISILSATILIGFMVSFLLNKRLGGQTGDTYGAVVELSELSGVLFAGLILGNS